ncbi:MAG: ADP-ribosylglycohydrolase family protein [Bacteroides sp.]
MHDFLRQFRGAVLLSAIGDALGWMTEFDTPFRALQKREGVARVEKFYNWDKRTGGRFQGYNDPIKAGSYSDDTQLALAVARCIGCTGRVDNERFTKVELQDWLLYARGAGATVKESARKAGRKKTEWFNNFYSVKQQAGTIDYRKAGANGAAMRILPIALANVRNPEQMLEEIFCNSITTHGHPRAIIGAMLYGFAVYTASTVQNNTGLEWLGEIGKSFFSLCETPVFISQRSEVRKWVELWDNQTVGKFSKLYRDVIEETREGLRKIYRDVRDKREPNQILKELGCFTPESKGSGIVTVLAGLFLAAKFWDDPQTGILSAVNAFGSDTDSIAAFTGGVLGFLHGEDSISHDWLTVQDAQYLKKTAEDLLAIANNQQIDRGLYLLQNPSKSHNLHDCKGEKLTENTSVYLPSLGIGILKRIVRIPTEANENYLLWLVEFDIGQSVLIHAGKDSEFIDAEKVRVEIKDLVARSGQVLDQDAAGELERMLNEREGSLARSPWVLDLLRKLLNAIDDKYLKSRL